MHKLFFIPTTILTTQTVSAIPTISATGEVIKILINVLVGIFSIFQIIKKPKN